MEYANKKERFESRQTKGQAQMKINRLQRELDDISTAFNVLRKTEIYGEEIACFEVVTGRLEQREIDLTKELVETIKKYAEL